MEPILSVVFRALEERGWQRRTAARGAGDVWVLPGMDRPFSTLDAVVSQTFREIADAGEEEPPDDA